MCLFYVKIGANSLSLQPDSWSKTNLIKDPPVARQPQNRPSGLFNDVVCRDCFGRLVRLLGGL